MAITKFKKTHIHTYKSWCRSLGAFLKISVPVSYLSTHVRQLQILPMLQESLSNLWWHGARGGALGWGTSRKVADSIPNGDIGIFHLHNPSGLSMFLGSTQRIKEIGTRNNYWGVKATGALG
jgi:hypothetical protein